jgi:hypothetical protein
MHSGGDPRSSNPGIASGGHGKVGADAGTDQSGARAQRERIAKEQELIAGTSASWRVLPSAPTAAFWGTPSVQGPTRNACFGCKAKRR